MLFPYLIPHLLSESAKRSPEAILIQDGPKSSSYAEIDAAANRIAHYLKEQGVQPGDRVALLAKNSAFYVVSYYGILRSGAVVVPLNTAATSDNVLFFLNDVQASYLLAGTGFERLLQPVLPALDANFKGVLWESAWSELSASYSDAALSIPRIDLDLAAIVYTSGSTGRPRGAMLTHLNVMSNTRSIVSYLNLTAHDRMGVILPFYYVYGTSLLNTHVAVGACLVLENRVAYPNVILDTLQAQNCTGFAGVPSTFAVLLSRSNLAEREFPALRYITQAGASMSPDITRKLMQALPGRELFIMYGASEASARISYLPPEAIDRKLGSIGKAIPNVEMSLRSEDGSVVAAGQVGEIVVRGSNIMQGYYGAPEETAKVLDEHGYHTGDLAYCDDEGFYFIVGRKKDMIKVGAHRVSPKEIEEALLAYEGVLEAAVIGVADETLGEVPYAYVSFQDNEQACVKTLSQFLRQRLAMYKMPKNIEMLAGLPKNESGKIMKEVLRERLLS